MLVDSFSLMFKDTETLGHALVLNMRVRNLTGKDFIIDWQLIARRKYHSTVFKYGAVTLSNLCNFGTLWMLRSLETLSQVLSSCMWLSACLWLLVILSTFFFSFSILQIGCMSRYGFERPVWCMLQFILFWLIKRKKREVNKKA